VEKDFKPGHIGRARKEPLSSHSVACVEPSALPPYKGFLFPVLRAMQALGGTAHAKEITAWMVENMEFDDDALAVEYPNRPGESVLLDRMAWARSYAKLGGVVETPQRGLYVLTAEGKRVLSLPDTEARQFVDEMDRQVRRARTRQKPKPIEQPGLDQENRSAQIRRRRPTPST
jgi:restriction system protein